MLKQDVIPILFNEFALQNIQEGVYKIYWIITLYYYAILFINNILDVNWQTVYIL